MLIVVVIHLRQSTIQQRYTLNSNGSVTYTEFNTQDSVEVASANIPQTLLLQFDHTYSATTYKEISRELVHTARRSAIIEGLKPYVMVVIAIVFVVSQVFVVYHSDDRNRDYIVHKVALRAVLVAGISIALGAIITKIAVNENLLEIGKVLIGL